MEGRVEEGVGGRRVGGEGGRREGFRFPLLSPPPQRFVEKPGFPAPREEEGFLREEGGREEEAKIQYGNAR